MSTLGSDGVSFTLRSAVDLDDDVDEGVDVDDGVDEDVDVDVIFGKEGILSDCLRIVDISKSALVIG